MNKSRIILPFLFLSLPVSMFAQATVSGRVTDVETGSGLAGANVVIEGTALGAAANATGNYS
ncbi:MAG: carboxypeptidase-like regulatory domain-containing protein, partial [Candidatus Neomarinimicrobiota bacterium]|nr:carboxypeptidase-like regulatory domain-containing protein [Candidatus Neomarinimicrobiota bacterium]